MDHDPHEAELRQRDGQLPRMARSLALSVRAELFDLPTDERIAKIKQLEQQQTAKRAHELRSSADATRLADRPASNRGVRLAESPDVARHIVAGPAAIPRSPERGQAAPSHAVAGRASLAAGGQIQTATLERPGDWRTDGPAFARRPAQLAALSTEKERLKLIGSWLQTAVSDRVETGGIRQNLPPIENVELQRFFREELSDQQREWLLPLSRDQRHRLLLRMYFLSPEHVAQLQPGQWPGWPLSSPSDSKPKAQSEGRRQAAEDAGVGSAGTPEARVDCGRTG